MFLYYIFVLEHLANLASQLLMLDQNDKKHPHRFKATEILASSTPRRMMATFFYFSDFPNFSPKPKPFLSSPKP